MAVFYTLSLECYRKEDALRLAARLGDIHLQIAGRKIHVFEISPPIFEEYWHVVGQPVITIGQAQYYRETLLDYPELCAETRLRLYREVQNEPGIRRALCGFEAQDTFIALNPDETRDNIRIPGLLYDRSLATSLEKIGNAQPLGSLYLCNLRLEDMNGGA